LLEDKLLVENDKYDSKNNLDIYYILEVCYSWRGIYYKVFHF